MITRTVQCQLKRDRVNDVRQALVNEVHPLLRQQQGFIDVLEALDPSTGNFMCTTLWKSDEDLQRYDQTAFQTIAQKIGPLALGEVKVSDLPVENSSAHRVALGKAA